MLLFHLLVTVFERCQILECKKGLLLKVNYMVSVMTLPIPPGPLGRRIHATYLPAHWMNWRKESTPPIRGPTGWENPRHLSAGPLGGRIHDIYLRVHWVGESTPPVGFLSGIFSPDRDDF